MNPILPIAAGGAALIGAGYLAYKGKKAPEVAALSQEQQQAAVLADSHKAVTSAQADVVSSTQLDAVTEEYNMAREKYRMIAGEYPPRSWSLDMINAWIEEQSRKDELLKQYVSLVADNSSYVSKQDTSSLTYKQIESLVDSTKAEIASLKEMERVRTLADTAKKLADAFRATLLAPNYNNLAMKGQNAWDTSTLSAMINLSPEGKSYCEYYFEAGGEVKLPGYFNQAKSAYKPYKTIASCILTSNTNTGRTGASTANDLRAAFQGVSPVPPKLGADGSVYAKKRAGIVSVDLMEGRKANAVGKRLILKNM